MKAPKTANNSMVCFTPVLGRKPGREETVAKPDSRPLPKLDSTMNAVILKQTWDRCGCGSNAESMESMSSAAAQEFVDAFTEAKRRHAQWDSPPCEVEV
eukprot:2025761-Amphidinium_carterae.1